MSTSRNNNTGQTGFVAYTKDTQLQIDMITSQLSNEKLKQTD